MSRAACMGVAAVFAMVLASAASAESFTYVNDRFGTSATFPADVFSEAEPAPANGDGRTWRTRDGASIAIFGAINALDETPGAMLADARARKEPGYELTYGKAGKDWVVLSGIDGGFVFYERREFGRDAIVHGLLIRYPPALKAKYDGLVGPIAATLRGP